MGGEEMLEKVKGVKEEVYSYAEVGQFYIDNRLGKITGIDSIKKFIDIGMSEIISESYRMMKQLKRSPYTFQEEVFHEILAPALARASKGFMMKSPIRVHWDNLDEEVAINTDQIWADYRCRYGAYNYCIEANKKSISYIKCKLTDEAKEEWTMSCEKLEQIKEKLEAHEKRSMVSITLQALNVYVSAMDETGLRYDLEGLRRVQKEAIKQMGLEYGVNWSCLWVLDREIVQSIEYIHGFEMYPAILFLARVN